jgi:hypothetical protein
MINSGEVQKIRFLGALDSSDHVISILERIK